MKILYFFLEFFIFNTLKRYYKMAIEEFGVTEKYSYSKSRIDFICMVRKKFQNSINKNNKHIEICGKNYNMIDYETYLRSRIDYFEESSKYSIIQYYMILMTIVVNILISTSNRTADNRMRIIFMLLSATCISVIYFDIASSNVHKRKASYKGFYKLTYEILQQVKEENEKKKIKSTYSKNA